MTNGRKYMNREKHRRIISRWRVIAIVFSSLLVGITAGIVPVATAQGSRFDCIVHQAHANGDVDWKQFSYSLATVPSVSSAIRVKSASSFDAASRPMPGKTWL